MTMQSNSYVWCNACNGSHPHGQCPPLKSAPQDDDVVDHEWREGATITVKMPKRFEREATPLEESLIDAQRIAGLMVEQMQELAKRVEMLQAEHAAYKQSFSAEWQRQTKAERVHIIEVLSAFVHAPISISSLQPVLDLAVELNPSLKERR